MAGKSRLSGLPVRGDRAATEPGRDGREELPRGERTMSVERTPQRSPAVMAGKSPSADIGKNARTGRNGARP